MKKILVGAGLVLCFGLGIWVSNLSFAPKAKEITKANSTVLLEKVQKVCKLVTVEGQFNELYDETNIRQFTVYLPFASTWNFSKSATLQVQGKVLVGYDMENISIVADSTNKRIIISNLPKPEILSIDHEITYKDLEESWFNSFKPEDYTAINQNAKKVLREKAEESRLLDEARQQGNQMLEVIRFMLESVGWELVNGDAVITPRDETKVEELVN